MGVVYSTGAAIAEPLQFIVDTAYWILPGILGALLIILFGYLLGCILGAVVRHVIHRTGAARKVVAKLGLQAEVGKWDFAVLLGLITKWYVFVIFLNPAAQVVNLTYLADFLNSAALWIPNVILAIMIALAGFVVAEYIGKKIRQVKSKQKSLLASTAKALTLIFTALIVLRQIGIAIDVAESAFLVVLAGVMLGLALAFGLGMQEDARELGREIRRRL
jgi:Zn-dependent protease